MKTTILAFIALGGIVLGDSTLKPLTSANINDALDDNPSSSRTALGLGTAATAALLDSDTMTGATASNVPSAESVVAYVAANGGTVDNAAVNAAIATDELTTRATVMGVDAAFNFVLVGDSIMAGTTSGGATSPNYLINTLPSKSYFSGRATVINKAISGRTTTQILSEYTSGANTDCYSYRPSNQGGKRCVVFVCAGINDWNTSASMVTALSNMVSYVAALKADGFEVWLGIPFPASYGGINDFATRTGMKAYVRGLKSMTTPAKKIDFNSLVHNMTGSGTGVIWTGDSLHPNDTLYQTMADYVNLRAWGDGGIADARDLGTLAFQDSDAANFDSTANFWASPRRYAATGTSAEMEFQVAGAGSNKKVKFGHTQTINGNVPANGAVVSIWNGSAWGTAGFSQEGGVIGASVRMVPLTVATLVANPTTNTFATVTDASSFTAGSTVTGGGSVKCMVQYDGAAWKMVMQLY